jgi:hypothetical protein
MCDHATMNETISAWSLHYAESVVLPSFPVPPEPESIVPVG